MKREILIEQHKLIIDNPLIHSGLRFDNIIIESSSDKTKWIEELTHKIGDWRGIFMNAYIKWAITINGLHIAKEKDEKIKDDDFKFQVSSVRDENGILKKTTIAEWIQKWLNDLG